jgi:hypothetical protein
MGGKGSGRKSNGGDKGVKQNRPHQPSWTDIEIGIRTGGVDHGETPEKIHKLLKQSGSKRSLDAVRAQIYDYHHGIGKYTDLKGLPFKKDKGVTGSKELRRKRLVESGTIIDETLKPKPKPTLKDHARLYAFTCQDCNAVTLAEMTFLEHAMRFYPRSEYVGRTVPCPMCEGKMDPAEVVGTMASCVYGVNARRMVGFAAGLIAEERELWEKTQKRRRGSI